MKSKLAIASFILSLMPIIVSAFFLVGTIISMMGTEVRTPEQVKINGEIVNRVEVKTISASDITLSSAVGTFGFIFFGFLPMNSLFLIASIVLGFIALRKIRNNNLEGKWFAIAGITISSLLIIMFVVFYMLTNGRGVA